MNDTIVVQVMAPAADRLYDIRLPLAVRLAELLPLIAAAVSELAEGLYEATDKAVLCSREDGTVYNINLSAAEAGLVNGSVLILI